MAVPYRHCERSEAIQRMDLDVPLDCFVALLLAMTETYYFGRNF